MTTRLSGLSSGLDVDSMVEALMKAHRKKLEKVQQKQQKLNWQQEDYRTISTSLVDFKNNKLATYKLSNSINAKTTSVTGNTSAITATASSTAKGSLTLSVDKLATAANTIIKTGITDSTTAVSSVLGADGVFTITNGSGKAISISYDTDDTLDDLVSTINSSSAGVYAIYDSTGQISITSNSTGAGSIVLAGLDIDDDADGTYDDSSHVTSTAGANAEVTINGLSMSYSSNKFTYNGMTIQLNNLSGDDGTSTISVVTDTDKVLSTIKSFISDYNTILSSINSELAETYDRDYQPLTDDEKDEMSDDEIEEWQEKARTGLLHNDTILSSLLSNLRMASLANVTTSSGKTLNLQSIGINTDTWDKKGQLVIEDEDKLTAALEDNADGVAKLFGLTTSGDSASATSTSSGIFTRMTKAITNTLDQLYSKAGTSKVSTSTTQTFFSGSTLSLQIAKYDTDIDNIQDWLDDREDYYYKKFTAMETAISKMNSVSSSLSSITG